MDSLEFVRSLLDDVVLGSSSPPSSSSSSSPIVRLSKIPGIELIPFAYRILLESLIRNGNFEDAVKILRKAASSGPPMDGYPISGDPFWNFVDGVAVDEKTTKEELAVEIKFRPSRVWFQDYSGLSALLDLAALRDAAVAGGLDAEKVFYIDLFNDFFLYLC